MSAQASQSHWERLVKYALGCVVGEMAQTWVPLRPAPDERPRWFPHEGPELLVTGRADHAEAPKPVADHLNGRMGGQSPLLYGWPIVVIQGRDTGYRRQKQVTPLFLLRLERTKMDGGKGWRLTPSHTPEFNAATLASQPEDADVVAEIRDLELPFEDADGMAQAADEVAQRLGHPPQALDPDNCKTLDAGANLAEGVHNAAIYLSADFAAHRWLVRQDLEDLREREDWRETAASWLVEPPRKGERNPSSPLAAALPCNESQEDALKLMRTQPLTIITGPPGTGKTQLVINAVVNAWLDGEKVLVASTNNAAVDVAVERANADVTPGLLVRTGRREIKQEVPAVISAAQARSRRFQGPSPERAARTMAQASGRRSAQTAKNVNRQKLGQRLMSLVRERDEMQDRLLEEAEAMAQGGQVSAARLAEIRKGMRPQSNAWAKACNQRDHAPAFVPRKVRTCSMRTRKRFTAAEAASLGKQAERLDLEGISRFVGRIKLRSYIGCPISTPMGRIREWASCMAEAEAERRRAEDDRKQKQDLDKAANDAERRLIKTMGSVFGGTSDAKRLEWACMERRLSQKENEYKRLGDECGKPVQLSAAADDELRRVDIEWWRHSLTAVQSKVAHQIADPRPGALPAFSSVSDHYQTFGTAVRKSLAVLRGWACTSMSARGSFPLDSALFDLVIVDEASQCTLADILPLAYRAKRIAIIGDPNQLRSITTLGDAHLRRIAKDAGQSEAELRTRGIHHKDGSAYQAFDHASEQAGVTGPCAIDEHYRCHPHIAKWFNEAFYGGSLRVLTPVSEPLGKRVLTWHDVSGDSRRPRDRGGWVNEAQGRKAVELVRDALSPDRSIGVITPYAAQGALIAHLATQKIDDAALADADFISGTAHKLQGSERDVIIFATTFTPNMPSGAAKWIEKERNLINVAASRARRHLLVIGHPDLDHKHSKTLASLREYIIGVRDGAGTPDIPVHSHSDAERLLWEAMRRAGLSPIGKMDVNGYELDFALTDGDIKVNVEVDGDHHRSESGRRRRNDLARDEILSALGWHVLRLDAWHCLGAPDDAAAEVREQWRRLRNSA